MLAYVHPLTKISITSEFGERLYPIYKVNKHHSGIDLKAKKGTPVRSILKGKVVFADFHGDYGIFVTILHENNITSHYAHLSKIDSKVGAQIKQGELIGNVGDTGASTGSHLHLEIRKDGVLLSPQKILYALSSKSKG
jgi:murein DD-endopeptidase MepM/ murein hydrolase activator NlpD